VIEGFAAALLALGGRRRTKKQRSMPLLPSSSASALAPETAPRCFPSSLQRRLLLLLLRQPAAASGEARALPQRGEAGRCGGDGERDGEDKESNRK